MSYSDVHVDTRSPLQLALYGERASDFLYPLAHIVQPIAESVGGGTGESSSIIFESDGHHGILKPERDVHVPGLGMLGDVRERLLEDEEDIVANLCRDVSCRQIFRHVGLELKCGDGEYSVV